MRKGNLTAWKPYWPTYAVLALALIYVAINVLQVGGYNFIFLLNNALLPPLLSASAAVSALWVRRQIVDSPNRRLWLGLAIGFLCWNIAETIWAVLVFIRKEVPFPSVADFFWLMGYLPMYFAFRKRLLTLPKIARFRKVWLWVLSFVFVSWALFFVVMPAVRSSTPGALFETVLSTVYAFADLILLLFTTRLLFAVRSGLYGGAWLWISAGLFINSVADLLYAYSFSTNTYYPGLINLISTLGTDVPYNLSYAVVFLGTLTMRRLIASFPSAVEVKVDLAPLPNTHILVFMIGNDTVIGVSQNYARVYPGTSVKGKTLSEVLGLSREDEALILGEIKRSGILNEKSFQSVTPAGQREIRVSGIRVQDPQGEYGGRPFWSGSIWKTFPWTKC